MSASDATEETIAEKCERLGKLCSAAQEAFEPNNAPWRWLGDAAKCYADAAKLLKKDDLAVKFVASEDR